jgi:phosphatidylglycerophosphatase C
MTGARRTVAAFDVDGTITTRDCVVPFMRRVTGARRIVPRLGLRATEMLPTLMRRDRDRLKALAASAAFRGRREVDVRQRGSDFAAFVYDNWLRADTVERLHTHVRNGDVVVLVSASFEVYLQPLAELLGADGVLALDGPNCRGAEKVRRLHAWLAEHHGGREALELVAYGDSTGDREMLADADVANWVGRRSAA